MLLALHPPLRQNLVGSSLESSMSMSQVTLLSLSIFLLSLEMICYEGSGRLKNVQGINPIPLQKSDLLCNTSKTTTHEQKMGHFIVPLPKKAHAKLLGKSRSQTVRRFLSLEQSLYAKEQFDEFDAMMNEYFEKGLAERVSLYDLEKSS